LKKLGEASRVIVREKKKAGGRKGGRKGGREGKKREDGGYLDIKDIIFQRR
jgi:hypothetical protein